MKKLTILLLLFRSCSPAMAQVGDTLRTLPTGSTSPSVNHVITLDLDKYVNGNARVKGLSDSAKAAIALATTANTAATNAGNGVTAINNQLSNFATTANLSITNSRLRKDWINRN